MSSPAPAPDAPPPRLSIGLVLSAGGGAARAYHAGTLSATDDHARFTGGEVSAEGRSLLDRIRPQTTVDAPGDADRQWTSVRPLRPSLAVRAATGRAALVTGLAGLAPAGPWSNVELGDRIRDLCGHEWPEQATWICAVRVRDGRRVVFGRDDVPTPDLGTAAQASCAVPRVIRPVRIGGDDYVDGGIHSTTNADLLATLAFDLVVVVSSMTTADPRLSPRHVAPWWFSRQLEREVTAIRAHGTPVLVIQPTAADVTARTGVGSSQLTVARQAYRSLAGHAERAADAETFDLLRAAAHDTAAPQPHR